MNTRDREELKEQLRAMVAGRGDGIDIDTPHHWIVEGLTQPVPFVEHLPSLLSADSVLYVEGRNIVPEVAAFYSSHRARNAVDVVRDTISPVPDIYHFSYSSEVASGLQRFAQSRRVPEMFDHLKAYQSGKLLFTFHDAFSGWLRISEHIPQTTVELFCRLAAVSCRREATKQRDPEQLRRFLLALENPGKVKIRIAGESRSRRFWRWLTRR